MSASLMRFILLPSMSFIFSPVIFFPPHYFEVPGKTVLNHTFIFNMLFLLLYSRIPSFPLLCLKNLMFLIVFMRPALLFLFWDSSLLYASVFQHINPFPPCSEILKSDYDVFQNRSVYVFWCCTIWKQSLMFHYRRWPQSCKICIIPFSGFEGCRQSVYLCKR